MNSTQHPPTLQTLARPDGGLAMVAMDQRESLRTMYVDAGQRNAADDDLIRFKRTVARVLSPHASGFLIDREYGYPQVREAGDVAPGTGLILAADALQQQPLGPVEDTELDEVVVADKYDLTGVVALKLLVIWRRDARRQARVELAHRFAEVCARRGVLSVLEPVVRPSGDEEATGRWNNEEAINEAADELSRSGQDLYKVQVPYGGDPTRGDLSAACTELACHIRGPWVVLSQGVARDHFADAVEAACRAGASGFLAGRAIWSDLVGCDDLATALQEVSVPRLEHLAGVVDRAARPWQEAIR